MIKQFQKTIIEKKRHRKKEEVRKNKKRKRDKKMIEKAIKKELFEMIFDESFLSFARIIIISNRTFNFVSFFDDRARQLSNELKKVRRQYQLKRMTELNQSKRLTIDEMLRYEYDLDTSDRLTVE
jgi:predicted butyrate kinase (DUF1464 family)